jgi:hypothetical protein
MIRFVADEDFDNDILRGLRRRVPEIDVVRAQEVGLCGVDDPSILAWAAREGLVLLTHDVSTMSHHALERVRLGLPMRGVIAVHQWLAIGDAIEDLVLVATCSSAEDWVDQLHYLPLR